MFANDGQTEYWFRLLQPALPDWNCLIGTLEAVPQWFRGAKPAGCNPTSAARIVLTQSLLGASNRCRDLLEALARSTHRSSELLLALRFLMHGNPLHSQDTTKFLLLPSAQPGQGIWARLIEQLLRNDGGTDSWRLLDDQWRLVLSPQLQQELKVSAIDADGAWTLLMEEGVDLTLLEFAAEQWSSNDVCSLLHGLFQSGGQSRQNETLRLLRKLRLHTLRGRTNEKVSVGDLEGELADGFVLDTPNLEIGLAPDLLELWQKFLSETKITELLPSDNLAAMVQRRIFERTDTDGESYAVQLDWNFVVRRALERQFPAIGRH